METPAGRDKECYWLGSRLNPKQAVLLLGCKGTGKTMLSQAVAHHTGAMWFDISPRNTDGKFSGKAAATMIHNVCGTRHAVLFAISCFATWGDAVADNALRVHCPVRKMPAIL